MLKSDLLEDGNEIRKSLSISGILSVKIRPLGGWKHNIYIILRIYCFSNVKIRPLGGWKPIWASSNVNI